MSTSLDIYPFHEVRQDAVRAAIAKFFSKLTGLGDISIEITYFADKDEVVDQDYALSKALQTALAKQPPVQRVEDEYLNI